MAENIHGISEPLMTTEPIVAKNPFDRPTAPGKPEPLETTEDSITITWTKPVSDGGSMITGYVVEKKEVGKSGWTRVTYNNVSDTRLKVGIREEILIGDSASNNNPNKQ